MFLRNVGRISKDYTALYSRIWKSSGFGKKKVFVAAIRTFQRREAQSM
jgi:hypothetical protein